MKSQGLWLIHSKGYLRSLFISIICKKIIFSFLNPGIIWSCRSNLNILLGTFLSANSSLPQDLFPTTLISKPVSWRLSWATSSQTQSICNRSWEIPQGFITPKALSTKLPVTQVAPALPVHHSKAQILLFCEKPRCEVIFPPQCNGRLLCWSTHSTSYPNTLYSLPVSESHYITCNVILLKFISYVWWDHKNSYI